MKNCALCKRSIEVRTKVVSVVGGLFPAEDPDFFMVDETIMKESYIHLDCLLSAISKEGGGSQS